MDNNVLEGQNNMIKKLLTSSFEATSNLSPK